MSRKKRKPLVLDVKTRHKFIRILKETGNVSLACEICEFDRRTAYRRKADDKVFAQAWEDAIEYGADELEQTLRDRALNGMEKPIFFKGEQVATIQEFDNTLGFNMLKGMKPDKYRNTVEVQSEALSDLVELMSAANQRLIQDREAGGGEVNALDGGEESDIIEELIGNGEYSGKEA